MKKSLILFWFLSVLIVSTVFAENDYGDELEWAYNYAYNIWITTMMPISNANMYGNLIRSHMAKMMVNYSTEILELVPNTGKVCEFDDIENETEELKWYIVQACQLNLMWVGITSFNTDGIVTRAEFGTVLSRALYGDKNNWWDPYYINHLNDLKTAGIMNVIDNPSMTEKRWYVMLMMKRADEIINNFMTWDIEIDFTPPTAKVSYSTTGSTTWNVSAYLTWWSETITWVNAYTHVFDDNGSFIFYFQDIAWNAGSVTANVTWIADDNNPSASVKYSTTWTTNQDVSVYLTWWSEELTWVNAYTHVFTGNGSFVFNFQDLSGNTWSVTATVNWIDKTAPSASISLNPIQANYTGWNIIATLTWYSENLTIKNNGWLNNYTFTGNGSFVFDFVDTAGNTGSTTATVNYWTGS